MVAPARPDDANRVLSLWDAAASKPVEECKGLALPLPDYVSVSADGRRMAYVDTQNGDTVKVYDWDRKRYLSTLPIGTKEIHWDVLKNQASFSPDGTLLALCGMHDGYRALLLYDVDLGDSAGILYCYEIDNSAWSGDGHWLITAGGSMVGPSWAKDDLGNGFFVHFSEVIRAPGCQTGAGEPWIAGCSIRFLHGGTQLTTRPFLRAWSPEESWRRGGAGNCGPRVRRFGTLRLARSAAP